MLSEQTDFEGLISHVTEGIFDFLLHLKILQGVVDRRLAEREGEVWRTSVMLT